MTYTLSNTCAKNLCKRTLLVQLIIKNVVTCFFFGTQCTVERQIETLNRDPRAAVNRNAAIFELVRALFILTQH